MNHRAKYYLFITIFISSLSVALNTDRHEILHAKSNSATLDHNTRISTYRGNVIVDQGTTHLTGDTLTVHTNEKNQVTDVITLGTAKKLATYRTIPELGKKEFYAEAETIQYYPQQNKVLFIGKAKATQDQHIFTGPRIEYDTVQQIVTSPASKEGRTTIVLQPQKKTSQTAP